MALKRRHKRHPIDGPWIIFEGGGKRTYRRRKTKAEREHDSRRFKLEGFRRDIVKEYIRENMFGGLDRSSSQEDYFKWAKGRIAELRAKGEEINIDIDQNASKS